MTYQGKFSKMRGSKQKMKDHEIKKHDALTGGCCQWRGRASYDSDVHIETVVLRGKFSGKIATEQQSPNRYGQC